MPWVNAELTGEDGVSVTWDMPTDTSGYMHFQVLGVGDFNPCAGDEPCKSGTIQVLGTTHNLYYEATFSFFPAYAVRVRYDSCFSEGVCSNVIYPNDLHLYYLLDFLIEMDDGSDPADVSVMVKGNDCYYNDSIYYGISDPSGQVQFDSILKGTYDLTIGKPGYQTQIIEDFELWQDTSLYIVLSSGQGGWPGDLEPDTTASEGGSGHLTGKKDRSRLHPEMQQPDPPEITVYPNPAESSLNISSNQAITELILYDRLGQVSLRRELNNKHIHLDVAGLESGIYFVRVISENCSAIQKIILR